ncbi:MAG: hypothetical protein M1839_004542 [Geoglossum umbratile]|nr:MAG: hypothetical protein M1839_004542 [Geoglossum umbratile]
MERDLLAPIPPGNGDPGLRGVLQPQHDPPNKPPTQISITELEPAQAPSSGAGRPLPSHARGSVLESKFKMFFFTWALAITTLMLSVFSICYGYTVLLNRGSSRVFIRPPGETVLTVNALSQFIAILLKQLLSSAFENLRWALVSRRKGTLITTFLALSQATSLQGIMYLFSLPDRHLIWCIQRVLSIGLLVALSTILLRDVGFKLVFTPVDPERIPVVAGLAPINLALSHFLLLRNINFFFLSFTRSILSDSTFVIGVPPVKCSGSQCKSYFFPGGLEQVRTQEGGRNESLFSVGDITGATAVVVYNAPGYHLEYSTIRSDYVFGDGDCYTYGEAIGEGLRLCVASEGPDLYTGWSVCPNPAYDDNECFKNTSWISPLTHNLSLSAYKRYSTVAYDHTNFSILSLESLSPPVVTPLYASDYRVFFDRIFGEKPRLQFNTSGGVFNTSNRTFEDVASSVSVQFALGWGLRLYRDILPRYENGPVHLFRGFLAIPIQFYVAIWEVADIRGIPNDLNTTASLSRVSYRATVPPWSVHLFTIFTCILFVWPVCVMLWVHFRGPHSPNTSLFPEVDITSKSGQPSTYGGSTGAGEKSADSRDDLTPFLREKGLGNGKSSLVRRGLRGVRVYLGARAGEDSELNIAIRTKNDGLQNLASGQLYS